MQKALPETTCRYAEGCPLAQGIDTFPADGAPERTFSDLRNTLPPVRVI